MGQNNMNDSEREAYKKEQAAKRRRMEGRQRQAEGGGPARSAAGGPARGNGPSKDGAKGTGQGSGFGKRTANTAGTGRPGNAAKSGRAATQGNAAKNGRAGNPGNGGRTGGGASAKGQRPGNPAKNTRGGNPAKSTRPGKGGNNMNGKKRPENKISKQVGIILCGIQFAVTLIFIVALLLLNMLPMKYLGVIIVVLVVLWAVPLASQLISKKKAIAGKAVSVLMSIVLAFGSFYIFKTNGTVQAISGGDKKVDKMVVAVMADDPAEVIADAGNYDFGVQYALKGEDVRDTIDVINKELGSEISTMEYKSMNEQAKALHDGDVKAIIYNDAYTAIMEESFEGYADSVKIIYTHEITSKLENKAAEVEVKDDCFTVYISGIDVYGAIETNSRSDVNIMAVVNPTTHQILLVTTPRDFYVEIPGVSGGQKDKLTHAGIYGVDASMATLGALYDTELDFYARVNFTSLIEMVDALGGIDVYSDQAFTTSADTTLVMNVAQGENHFNGQQALAFSRERMNIDGGDFQRGKNQQAVITAMIKKAISPAILTGANGLLSSVSGNVDTNMSQEQIQELIKSQLSDGAAWNIKSMAAEGAGDNQECYSSPGESLYVTQPDQNSITAIKQAIDAVEQGEILPDSEVAQ